MHWSDSVLIIGVGNLGRALLSGVIKSGTLSPSNIKAVEKSADRLKEFPDINFAASLHDLPDDYMPDAIIVAVKPGDFNNVLTEITKRFCNSSGVGTADRLPLPFTGGGRGGHLSSCHSNNTFVPLIISVAAGKTIKLMESLTGGQAAIIRAMPNTPAAIGQAVTVACANAACSDMQRDFAAKILKSIGSLFWVEGEDTLNAVTALSGSGPAYVFYFLESLIEAGVKNGLPQELADQLARLTLAGAGNMALQSSTSLEEMRRAVTSPSGTTEAALKVLSPTFPALIEQAITAATTRARELG